LPHYGPTSTTSPYEANRILMETRVSGHLQYATDTTRTVSNPPRGMQAIPMLYFQHFRVLPISWIMSQIPFAVGVPLCEITPGFVYYLRGFVNIFIALNLRPQRDVFLYFYSFACQGGTIDRVGYSRCSGKDSVEGCVAFAPTNHQ